MNYGFIQININAPFPTKQCGHMSQTALINTYQDDLHARCLYLEDDKQIIMHVSFDLLAVDLAFRNLLQATLQKEYTKPLHLITSATHTHYANDVLNKEYQQYLFQLLVDKLNTIEIKHSKQLNVSMQTIPYNEIGTSRITGFHNEKVYLSLLSFYDGNQRFASIIMHNVHPTILSANVPFFSSEFPGFVMETLSNQYQEAFSWCTGASGDISTRFTRDGQDYEAMRKLAKKLINTIESLLSQKPTLYPCELKYHEETLTYEHDFHEIDLSSIREQLSPRELLSIEYGKILRAQLQETKDVINEIQLASLRIGPYRIVFYPNEIFSQYLENIDINTEMLVSYSNGYGPYILPINFPYLTYESFCDTLSDDCKCKIAKAIQTI